jgi:hypothetical protein
MYTLPASVGASPRPRRGEGGRTRGPGSKRHGFLPAQAVGGGGGGEGGGGGFSGSNFWIKSDDDLGWFDFFLNSSSSSEFLNVKVNGRPIICACVKNKSSQVNESKEQVIIIIIISHE